MVEEIWKSLDFLGYFKYEVSNRGNVKSLNYNIILKPFKNRENYLSVLLSKNNKSKHFKVHRLVAFAFIDNPENKATVNHIDCDRMNNNLENLEWATVKEQNALNKKNLNKKIAIERKTFTESELKTEIWKLIPLKTKFDYYVSNLGRIKKILLKQCEKEFVILSGTITHGYTKVKLSLSNNTKKSLTVHNLVALVFLIKPEYEVIVNHKDGNRSNNCLENLEYITRSENNLHALDTGLWKTRKKVKQFDLDGNFIMEYNSSSTAIKATGIKNITDVFRGRTKNCGGFLWELSENNINYDIKIQKKKVAQYDLNNNLIKIFESATEAAKINKIKHSQNVSSACRKNRIAYGYIWKYV